MFFFSKRSACRKATGEILFPEGAWWAQYTDPSRCDVRGLRNASWSAPQMWLVSECVDVDVEQLCKASARLCAQVCCFEKTRGDESFSNHALCLFEVRRQPIGTHVLLMGWSNAGPVVVEVFCFPCVFLQRVSFLIRRCDSL